MSSMTEAVSSVGGAITSPAKLAFAGYVLLAYNGAVATSTMQFIAVAIVFIVIQVFHDDWLRIRLNNRAKLQGEQAWRRAFPGDKPITN